MIYTCGPEPMMKRVAEIAAARGIDCQIAVERAMACGMGTCQSCCIRVRKPDASKPPLVGRDWCYRLACTDGPGFRGGGLLWETSATMTTIGMHFHVIPRKGKEV